MAEACVSFVSLPFESLWPPGLKAAVYTCGMLYCFLGLGLIAQQYMSAMDNIVKQTRTVTCKDEDSGAIVAKEVKIWNPTIADITLLALGTSAPPISLAIISALQQLGKPSLDADVGTGTMLGGAAFNFFAILAACILIPRNGTIKRVANFGVFLVELVWSIWAYVWLFIVFAVWTPGRVTVLEAILTVLHMPVLMLHAYAQDQQWPLVSLAYPRHPDRRHDSGEGLESFDELDSVLVPQSSDEGLRTLLCRDNTPSLGQPGALALSLEVLALSPNSLAFGTSTGRISSSKGGATEESRAYSLDIQKAASAPDPNQWRGGLYDSVAHLVSPLQPRGPLSLFPQGSFEAIREEESKRYGDSMDVTNSNSMHSVHVDGDGHRGDDASSLPLMERTLSEAAGETAQGRTRVPNSSDWGGPQQSGEIPAGTTEWPGSALAAWVLGGIGAVTGAGRVVEPRHVADSASPGSRLKLLVETTAGSPQYRASTPLSAASSPPGNPFVGGHTGHRAPQVHLIRSPGSSTRASGDIGGARLSGAGEQKTMTGRRMGGPERAASSPPWTPEHLGTPGVALSLPSLDSKSKEGMRRRSFVEGDRALDDLDRGREKGREEERARESVSGVPERESTVWGAAGQPVLAQSEGKPRLSMPTEAPFGVCEAAPGGRESARSKNWDEEKEGEVGGDREPTAMLLVTPDRAGVAHSLHVSAHIHPRYTAGGAHVLSPSRSVEAGFISQTALDSGVPDSHKEGHTKHQRQLGMPDKFSEGNQSKYRERGARVGGGIPPVLQQQCRQLWVLCCYGWRALFAAVVPPPDALHGWPAFLVSIGVISGVSMIVIELANVLGCVTGVDSFIISMTVLASGTSVPNIIASAIAAQQSPHADSAIANVNASNSINVYLGLGLPWVITSTYDTLVLHKDYTIDASALGPSLLVYFGTIGAGLMILFGRRWIGGGELGGNRVWALGSAAGLLGLWVIYCVLSLSLYYHVL